jgi:urease subunit gamma/beta
MVNEGASMRLTPQERDRLLIFTAAELARARRARGLRLNVPETIALVADTVIEAARDGRRLGEAIEAGRSVLGPDDVLPGVADVVTEVSLEAVFDDGTRLAVVPDPVGGRQREEARPGAVAPAAAAPAAADPAAADQANAGPPAADPAAADRATADPANAGPAAADRDSADRAAGVGAPVEPDIVALTVTNTAGVPVSVTSHWHFFEANPRLRFDRAAAFGRHLAVPAGASVRFDPGVAVPVRLVPIGGKRVAIGFAGLVDGPLDAPGALGRALARARSLGYLDTARPDTGRPDTARPDTTHAGTARPDTAHAGIARPDTTHAGIARPDSADPGTGADR